MTLLERVTPFLLINLGIVSVAAFALMNYRSRNESRSAKRIHRFVMVLAVGLGAIAMELIAVSLLFRGT